MKRPSNTLLLTLALLATGGALILRLQPLTFEATTEPEAPAQRVSSLQEADSAVATRQGSVSAAAMPQNKHPLATKMAPPRPSSHPATNDQITTSPKANASIPEPNHTSPSLQIVPEAAATEDNPFLPAIQLAEDVRLPAALMPHQTANESPAVTAARIAIGERFYRELQEIVANQAPADAAVQAPVDAAATTVIHQSRATENALRRANEEYRALFGDEAFNRKTMDTHLEVKLPVDVNQDP